MKKKTRIIILFLVVVFLAGALTLFKIYNEGPVNIIKGKAIEVNPVALYTSYITDSSKAHKNYDGKIVTMTGEVSGITENSQRQQVILIKTTARGGNINCTMEQPALEVSAGSIISVKGVCTGLGEGDADLGLAGDVYITRAIIAN